MAKKNKDLAEALLGAIAIISGSLLAVEILKSLSKKETVYDCPVCNYPIKFGTNQCPNCNSKLTWPTQEQVHGK